MILVVRPTCRPCCERSMGSRPACRTLGRVSRWEARTGLGFGGRSAAPTATSGRRGGRKGAGICAQHLQEARGPVRGAKRGRHRFFRPAAIDIEVEEVFPRGVSARSGFQLAEVDAELVEAG